MQNYPRQQGQSQIVCGGCRTLLMFPQGAQNVRCARCSHITPVPPSVSQDMAQLHCTNPSCRVMLMYPRGALHVQCSLCGTLNDAQQSNQLGHLVCGGCQVTLMYAHGAQSVKCAVCNHITPVPPSRPSVPPPAAVAQHQQYPSTGPLPPAGPSAGSRQQTVPPGDGANNKLVQAVLVENPPGLDDQGHEVQTIALGVKKENDVG